MGTISVKYTGTFPIPANSLDPTADSKYKTLTSSSSSTPGSAVGSASAWKEAPPGSVTAAVQAGASGPVLAEGISPISSTSKATTLPPAELQQLMDKVAVGQFGRVYVRVIGVGSFNGQMINLGVVSNLVGYDPPKKNVNTTTKFTLESTRASIPWRPDPSLGSCVRVFQVNWEGDLNKSAGWKNIYLASPPLSTAKQNADAFAASKFYPAVGMYCPGDFGFKDECGFWCQVKQLDDMFAHIWDEFAAFYNNIGATIGEFIAEHNPICDWADSATDSPLVGPVCKAITKIAVEAIVKVLMSAVGLPPTVPTSTQLRQIAKAKLKELAKAGIEYVGVPCDDLELTGTAASALDSTLKKGGVNIPPQQDANGQKVLSACDAIVDLTYNKIEADVRNAMNKTVVEQSGIPWFDNIPGFLMAPEPRAFIPAVTIWASIILDEKSTWLGFAQGSFTLLVDSYSIYFPSGQIQVQDLGNHLDGAFETLKNANDFDLNAATEAFLNTRKTASNKLSDFDGKGRFWGITSLAPIMQEKTIYYGSRAMLQVNATTEEVIGLPVRVEARFPA